VAKDKNLPCVLVKTVINFPVSFTTGTSLHGTNYFYCRHFIPNSIEIRLVLSQMKHAYVQTLPLRCVHCRRLVEGRQCMK
jgi:hypothetical protein